MVEDLNSAWGYMSDRPAWHVWSKWWLGNHDVPGMLWNFWMAGLNNIRLWD